MYNTAMKKIVYIFRHGETDSNSQKRMQGWLDVPLNANGVAQARVLAQRLADVKFDVVYSSPSSRALDTARAKFGVRLYQKMAQKYGATDYSAMQFIVATHDDGMGGGYDWDKTISVSTTEITDFAGFVSVFVHEFSHYIYNKLPHKSPINAQLVDIAKQNYVPGPSPTKAHFEKYKNQPFEKTSYALMDYFANHDFVGKLAVAIRIKQNTLSWGME